jgi:hypothetical protein
MGAERKMVMHKRSFAALSALAVASMISSSARAIVVGDTSPNAYNEPPYLVDQSSGVLDGVAELVVLRTDLQPTNPNDPPVVALGTTTLLTDGMHLLTAAHMFTDTSGTNTTIAAFVIFHTESGTTTMLATGSAHPLWNGNALMGNDIAVVTLDGVAPSDATRYGIYTGSDEVGQTFTTAGFGQTGNGNTGGMALDPNADLEQLPLRQGQNKVDALGDVFNAIDGLQFPDGTTLGFDFDNGLAENDAFGTFYGIHDTGVVNEVSTSHGDSGGPLFIDNQIAGITSIGFALSGTAAGGQTVTTDVDDVTNSSFGEFALDTRVSAFQDFIAQSVPEPASSGVLFGFMLLLNTRRGRQAAGLH